MIVNWYEMLCASFWRFGGTTLMPHKMSRSDSDGAWLGQTPAAETNERTFHFYCQGTATGARALARRGRVLLPLPKGESRGEGEVHSRFTRVAVPALRFSPLIPLPRGEGNK